MQRIVELLNDKNVCLEKFYRLNEAELMNFSEGNFDNLEAFYRDREALLDLIGTMDRLIEDENLAVEPGAEVQDDFKKGVLKALNYKNELVTRILSQDLQILSFIETAKSDLIKELAQVRAARKAMGAYQSGSASNRLDEEY